MSSAPTRPVPEIEEIRLDRDKGRLTLAFAGGRADLSAPRLRAACRCAACLAARAQGRFTADFSGITLAGVAPFGAHGLNLTFSDGHARGVYPFAYLLALAADGAATDLPEVTS
ncbi:DUF971 domain-containing protein [Xanthobacter dioxanivorans]|uniref:DUF971 domain-containing protein n=2 Tax=Xanthobacter dioxanivorans TaxID=2528964 RepID=A0A974PTR3_9HYPH|nr:DUF971 domain-containing protein [Xanthobacter dioxanivorans]